MNPATLLLILQAVASAMDLAARLAEHTEAPPSPEYIAQREALRKELVLLAQSLSEQSVSPDDLK